MSDRLSLDDFAIWLSNDFAMRPEAMEGYIGWPVSRATPEARLGMAAVAGASIRRALIETADAGGAALPHAAPLETWLVLFVAIDQRKLLEAVQDGLFAAIGEWAKSRAARSFPRREM